MSLDSKIAGKFAAIEERLKALEAKQAQPEPSLQHLPDEIQKLKNEIQGLKMRAGKA